MPFNRGPRSAVLVDQTTANTPSGGGEAVHHNVAVYGPPVSDYNSQFNIAFVDLSSAPTVTLVLGGSSPGLTLTAVAFVNYNPGEESPINEQVSDIAAKWQSDADNIQPGLATVVVSNYNADISIVVQINNHDPYSITSLSSGYVGSEHTIGTPTPTIFSLSGNTDITAGLDWDAGATPLEEATNLSEAMETAWAGYSTEISEDAGTASLFIMKVLDLSLGPTVAVSIENLVPSISLTASAGIDYEALDNTTMQAAAIATKWQSDSEGFQVGLANITPTVVDGDAAIQISLNVTGPYGISSFSISDPGQATFTTQDIGTSASATIILTKDVQPDTETVSWNNIGSATRFDTSEGDAYVLSVD